MTPTQTHPIRYWKVLDESGRACHGGTFAYDLPTRRKPGQWTPRVPNLALCKRGYHLCRDADLVHWCNGATIYAAEARGAILVGDDKVVAESVRLIAPTPWDSVTARLFAVECAADVLYLMTDKRSHTVLEVAYRFALGDADQEELNAARDAARAAAWAARDAERASERASERAAAWAERDAAWAARDAAWAARDAAWAEGAAARDAAWAARDAAWAEGAAARAARDAARDAAWAERDAAWARQTHRLMWWLGASATYPEPFA